MQRFVHCALSVMSLFYVKRGGYHYSTSFVLMSTFTFVYFRNLAKYVKSWKKFFFIDMLTTNKHTLAIFIQMSLGNVASNRITISGSGARGEINTTAVCSPSHSTAPPFSVNAIYFRRQKNAKCSPPWKICFAILFKRSYDEERCWAKIDWTSHFWESRFWNKSSCKSSDHLQPFTSFW